MKKLLFGFLFLLSLTGLWADGGVDMFTYRFVQGDFIVTGRLPEGKTYMGKMSIYIDEQGVQSISREVLGEMWNEQLETWGEITSDGLFVGFNMDGNEYAVFYTITDDSMLNISYLVGDVVNLNSMDESFGFETLVPQMYAQAFAWDGEGEDMYY